MTKKKKIGIVTTHHEPNYGNKLQNFALQSVLQNLGFEVETINDARSWPDLTSWWAQKKYLLHAIIPFRRQPWHIKYTKFFFWSKKHIHYSKVNIHSDEDTQGLADMYDYFVVGSDQIWNPEWPIFSNAFGFASFARKEQKIAYAPSFGISYMLSARVREYKEWLKDWKSLSCREEDGAAIIKELIGKDVPVVVDPTMLLNKTDWDKVVAHRRIKGEYAVIYTIGGMREEYRDYIHQICEKKGLSIVNLSEGKYASMGPDEFIAAIKYASLMITDSFHGSVFAIQYHVPITIINRTLITGEKDKMSRIRTLFRYIETKCNFTELFNEFHTLDWARADKSVNKHRCQSLAYLRDSLK